MSEVRKNYEEQAIEYATQMTIAAISVDKSINANALSAKEVADFFVNCIQ